MIARAQQRDHDRADRGHAGAEADCGHAVFHAVDLFLERRRGGVTLPTVGVTRSASLEYGREVLRTTIAVGDRKVERLVQRAVLDRRRAIRVQDRGCEAAP